MKLIYFNVFLFEINIETEKGIGKHEWALAMHLSFFPNRI